MDGANDEDRFDLVGIDPDSQDGRCPGVWVEPETDDIYFRGKVVTDPLILARFEADAPSSADEGIFKIPSRMRAIVAEAATGTYDKGRTGHGEIELHDLLKTATPAPEHRKPRGSRSPQPRTALNHPQRLSRPEVRQF